MSRTVPLQSAFDFETPAPGRTALSPGAVLLGGFALAESARPMDGIGAIAAMSPLRHMTTPGGWRMSAAMTSCGAVGWVSDRSGYRYDALDPLNGAPWPDIPDFFLRLAEDAARTAGFDGFRPDTCLINRYEPGARMSLHQDRNERDTGQPVVSISLGVPAIFLWGGMERSERPAAIRLEHGDVVVWGGPSRLNFHGIRPVAEAEHALTGRARFNITFRRAR